jgi:integrase
MKIKPERKRRGRGEHSVYQRADGRWAASISLGYREGGQRKRRVVYGATKKEVQDKLDSLRRDVATGTKIEPTKTTVKEFLARWLAIDVKPNRQPGTYRSYAGTLKNHVYPRIGSVRLQNLDAMQVASLYVELETAGVPARTRELVHVVLRRAFRRAVKWGMKGFNPAADAERPKVVRRDIPIIEPEQANALLVAAAGHRLEALFTFAVATGMRQGELFGLQWRDVDVKSKQVHVRHSLEELGGKLRLKEPKSASGKRSIILPSIAIEAVAEHRKRMLAEGHCNPESPVFCDTAGGWLRKSNFLRKVYAPILKAAGLTGIRFHDWRHYHASQLVALGTSPRVVQERIGHADVGTTLRFYVHPRHEAHQSAADQFDAAFRAKKAAAAAVS